MSFRTSVVGRDGRYVLVRALVGGVRFANVVHDVAILADLGIGGAVSSAIARTPAGRALITSTRSIASQLKASS